MSEEQKNEILKRLDELINEISRDNARSWNISNMKIDKIADHLGIDMNEFRKQNF